MDLAGALVDFFKIQRWNYNATLGSDGKLLRGMFDVVFGESLLLKKWRIYTIIIYKREC